MDNKLNKAGPSAQKLGTQNSPFSKPDQSVGAALTDKNKQNRGFAPIIILVIIAIVIVGYVFLQGEALDSQLKQQDTNTQWKTYTDAENNFSFQYHPDLNVNRVDDDQVDRVNLISFPMFEGEEKINFLTELDIYNNSTKLSLEDYVLQKICKANEPLDPNLHGPSVEFQKQFKEDCINAYNESNMPYKIDEIDGIRANVFIGFDPRIVTIIENKGVIYSFSLDELASNGKTGNDQPSEKSIQLYDQILSTFKFTQ